MKAEDTILDESEKRACSLIGNLPYKDYKAVIDEACLHQAEISFRAGIKEVVEWLENHLINMDSRTFPNRALTGADYQRLQAQLKKWSINES